MKCPDMEAIESPVSNELDQSDRDYLRLQYQEGANTIRAFIDTRYKILQFIGVYNAGVLTIGFGQGILITTKASTGSLVICTLSALVSVMGLVTEFSLSAYNQKYFTVLRSIESRWGKNILEETGIFSHGGEINRTRFYKVLPVYRAHRLFYTLLFAFWVVFFCYEVARFV